MPSAIVSSGRSLLLSVYRTVRDRYRARRLQGLDVETIFSDLVRRNAWRGRASVSGLGSDPAQTRTLVQELPELFRRFDARTVLDLPCGDFGWMRDVDLSGIDYVGADIVGALIDANQKYGSEHIRFLRLNLLEDALPRVDLVLCRDCLVHFSIDDVFRALANICRSGSTYLLTTTFTGPHWNRDIHTGQWRAIKLTRHPFDLPEPLALINENCSERHYSDKSLGLWNIADIAARLSRMGRLNATSQ